MENKIIVAAHGTCALGIKSAVELISGEQKNVLYLPMYVDNTTDYEKEVETLLKQSCASENVVVVTDLSGGSVNRLFMKQLPHHSFHLLSNLNLGLVLELVLAKERIDSAFLQRLVESKALCAVYCNPMLTQLDEEEEGRIYD